MSGGIPNMRCLRSGATNPTAAPQNGPQMNPQSSAGMCMGDRAYPICGICIVRNGSTIARARHIAARVSVLMSFF